MVMWCSNPQAATPEPQEQQTCGDTVATIATSALTTSSAGGLIASTRVLCFITGMLTTKALLSKLADLFWGSKAGA